MEQYADEQGISWPAAMAPFDVHLVVLGRDGSRDRFRDGRRDVVRVRLSTGTRRDDVTLAHVASPTSATSPTSPSETV